MPTLSTLRQKLNLTQEELSDKSGVSVRTIQRIEAGTAPQGYTLKALAEALGVNEIELLETGQSQTMNNSKWLKIINLSALPFAVIPPLNIAVPLLLMIWKKQSSPVSRKIISIQVLWTLIAIVLMVLVMMLNDWFGVKSQLTLLIPLAWILINVIIILLNAAGIEKDGSLRISMNFSIL
ncbi:helix-turn-helix domain-containing protein [Emticicia sp. CRIBPO]|uniref:helix-turn-helix domain-containing protein n=1 Tax=Emticicia sp. CRIBPO TaxID=2683258 RepID=UPI001411DFF2|nr:helix-turn-helix transcriptional regulator [Emticicia sp. CRIBPO]NBA88961.1 helix-turn-helix domain-containing protein [Emticicia sp. CRIBPO]